MSLVHVRESPAVGISTGLQSISLGGSCRPDSQPERSNASMLTAGKESPHIYTFHLLFLCCRMQCCTEGMSGFST